MATITLAASTRTLLISDTGIFRADIVVTNNTSASMRIDVEDPLLVDARVIAWIPAGGSQTFQFKRDIKLYGTSSASGTATVLGGSASEPKVAAAQIVDLDPTDATNNVAILNAALLANSWVVISALGTYEFNNPILIPSNCRLTINPGVTLKLAASTNKYLIRNYGLDGVLSDTSWATGNTNITIDGGGALDFNFANNNTTGGINTGTGAAYGGAGAITNWPGWGIGFYGVTQFTIRDLSITGLTYASGSTGAKYLVAMTSCTDGVLERLTLDNTSDGIHCLGGCKRIYMRDIRGTTGDDMIAVTPADYAAYVINAATPTTAGSRADCEDIHLENIVQLGDKSAVKFLGTMLDTAGPTYIIRNCSAKNVYAKPRKSTYPAVYVAGVNGCTLENVYGWMSPDTAVITVNVDSGISTNAALSLGKSTVTKGLKLKNITRQENGSFGAGTPGNREEYSGTKLGRLLSVLNVAQVTDLDLDGGMWLTSAGAVGAVVGGGTGGIDIDPQLTATPPGYCKNVRIRNCTFVDANAAAGRFIVANKGLCYDGSAYTGSLVVEGCTIDGATYGLYMDQGSSVTNKISVTNCTFKNVPRAIYLDITAQISFNGCHFDSGLSRVVQIGTTNIVDIRWGSGNFVGATTADLWYHATPGSNLPKSVQAAFGTGYVAVTGTATGGGQFEPDTIHATSGTFTLTLRNAYPGKRVTVINSGAGTVTMASSGGGTFSTGTVAAGVTTAFVATTYRDWQVVA